MQLKTYFETAPRGEATRLAKALNVSTSYLSQIVSGASPISPTRCIQIERETNKAVTRADLRSDWQEIWPEYNNQKIDPGMTYDNQP